MQRRQFLKIAASMAAIAPLGGACYGFAQSTNLGVDRRTIHLPNLPSSWDGATIAFLTDIHLGPFLTEDYVRSVVRTTMALRPDLILLGGDYAHRESSYLAPCFEILAGLSAPLGVHGVMGNHDAWLSLEETRRGMARAKVQELTNRGVWLTRGSGRLRLAGVDDLWTGKPDVAAALGDATQNDAVILLSHNPDVAETMTDRRVGLMLSGHTHGGQVVMPGIGAPWTPSRYGKKYAHGLAEGPTTRVLTSAGIGLSGVAVRANCTPEITHLTLRSS